MDTTVETTIYRAPEFIREGVGRNLYAALFAALAERTFILSWPATCCPTQLPPHCTCALDSSRSESSPRTVTSWDVVGWRPRKRLSSRARPFWRYLQNFRGPFSIATERDRLPFPQQLKIYTSSMGHRRLWLVTTERKVCPRWFRVIYKAPEGRWEILQLNRHSAARRLPDRALLSTFHVAFMARFCKKF
jgi:hypothetical protein